MAHPDCKRLISESWSSTPQGSVSYSFAKSLKSVKKELVLWNKKTFGNIKTNIQKIKNSIEEKSQSVDRFPITIKRLENSLQHWKDIEEDYWKTKSRNNIIRLGDRNTSFFHNSARTRYRRNRIETIKDDHGCWLNDRISIAKCFTFSKIATTSNPVPVLI